MASAPSEDAAVLVHYKDRLDSDPNLAGQEVKKAIFGSSREISVVWQGLRNISCASKCPYEMYRVELQGLFFTP